jgi:hypothetical protein
MSTRLIASLLVLLVTGCASVEFQPYEGKDSTYEGR